MKIALVSVGLGRVHRGFEAFTQSLYIALKKYAPELDITLFKGGRGREKGEVVVPHISRKNFLVKKMKKHRADLIEKRSFALSLYPFLRFGNYQIVHYNELTMGSVLFHLRRFFGGKFKLLYCNGAPSPPLHFHRRCDFAQILTPSMFEECINFGFERERLFLLPYGVDSEKFNRSVKNLREKVRKELNLPHDAKIVLTAAALKKEHKRVDYVIREVSKAGNDFFLLAVGERERETPELEEIARTLLPERHMFITVDYDKMPSIYGASDVFVLGSLTEGFGLVVAEALMCGLPVIVHNNEVFRWVTEGSRAVLTDMRKEGALARALREVLSEKENYDSSDVITKRFAWKFLIEDYIKMYIKVIDGKIYELH